MAITWPATCGGSIYLEKATKLMFAPFRIISMEKRSRMAFLFVVRP